MGQPETQPERSSALDTGEHRELGVAGGAGGADDHGEVVGERLGGDPGKERWRGGRGIRRDRVTAQGLGEAGEGGEHGGARGERQRLDPAGHRLGAARHEVRVCRRSSADAGLVSVTADAQRRRVHLEAAALAGLVRWIERHQRAAEARLSRLEAVLANLDSPTSPNTTPTKGKTS